MELKQFIKQTISDIEGAKKELHDQNNDLGIEYCKNSDGEYGVNFDLVVGTEDEKGGKGTGKIAVFGSAVEGELLKSSKMVNSNRVKFGFRLESIKESSDRHEALQKAFS